MKTIVTKLTSGAQNRFHKIQNSGLIRKGMLMVGAFIIATGELQAQSGSKGAAGFTQATQEISSYQTPVSNLMKAIAGVIVLIGIFNVYFKMQNGDQDVKKTIMLTIGGCVAFIAMAESLPLFFS